MPFQIKRNAPTMKNVPEISECQSQDGESEEDATIPDEHEMSPKFWKSKRLLRPMALLASRSCDHIRTYFDHQRALERVHAACNPRVNRIKKPRVSESRKAILKSQVTSKHHRRHNTFFSLDEVLSEICKDWNNGY